MSTNDDLDLPPLPRPFMELQRELVPVVYEAWQQQMQAYAREAVAAEREACAKACELEAAKWELDGEPCAPILLCSAAIRARDEQ